MCGIIGYIGENSALPVLLNGLKELEYRGYDSCGVSLIESGEIFSKSINGRIEVLERLLENNVLLSKAKIGIGHTRWATHGKANIINAHPHLDCSGDISVVHNGVIENYEELKKFLKNHKFKSETDTEVVPHLIEEFLKRGYNLENSFLEMISLLEGSYALAMISKKEPGKIFVAKKSSPLVLGFGKKEVFLSSDISPILEWTNKIVYLEDGDVAVLEEGKYKILNSKKEVSRAVVEFKKSFLKNSKGDYPTFMLKEIFEQPKTITKAFSGRIDYEKAMPKFGGLGITEEEIKDLKRIIIVGCGTSWNAALEGKLFFEEISKIHTDVEYSSEFRYSKGVLEKGTILLALSQSGETADTISAIEKMKSNFLKSITLVNKVGSTISKLVDGGIYLHAGQETGVAATKTFSSQLVLLYLLSIYFARVRGVLHREEAIKKMKELENLPNLVEEILKKEKIVKSLSSKYSKYDNVFYMGREEGFPIALEGALKLKEISYVHAEAYPSAELKHGPIALIDEKTLSIFIIPDSEIYKKNLSNLIEVKTRGGKTLAIASEGNSDIEKNSDSSFYIPKVSKYLRPILEIIPLQLFAYYVGIERGKDVDKPRNLAKCVTVE